MASRTQTNLSSLIIDKAKSSGASLAGLTSIASLLKSPYYQTRGEANWPEEAKSVLVLALLHEEARPELDWWDGEKGGTRGNRSLQSTMEILQPWLSEKFKIKASSLPYHIEKGGMPLKDAAVLAGLGVIGRNNLLITPEFGTRVRLRAMLLDAELTPAGPLDFTPCAACDMPCRQACPQKAFAPGSYSRALCQIQMTENEANKSAPPKTMQNDSPGEIVKYCRACELACPIP
ncbi:MAG: epoxyqueuosine reductase [Deltaproteobacteria bacterium]|nr:epoxyqueuosine reductase [Deltaproteobacteria bacterium]MBW2086432.1 epoxyqueuosine reductase [Deltaproteobacteria bacterium]